MAFIIKSNTKSNSTRKLYRDPLVTPATRLFIDTDNAFSWDTPGVLPVANKALRDLSPNDHGVAFSGAGFDDSTASDGIHFQQGSSGILEVGNAGEIDLSTENVTAFYISIWMARAAGFDVGDFQGIAEHGQFNRNDSAWLIDLDQDGTSPLFAVGGIGRVGEADRDLVADEITQYAFSYETDGVDSTLRKYKNGALFGTVKKANETGLISLPAQTVKIGTGGGGSNAGFRLYRMFLEVISVSSGNAPASGNEIAKQVAYDYDINKDRFTF